VILSCTQGWVRTCYTSLCHTRIFLYGWLYGWLYTPFGDGEGRDYTVCPSVNVCQWNQQKSVARMSQNFHHIFYISDYNISPMQNLQHKCCRFSSYIVYKWLQYFTNENLWHECHRLSSYIVDQWLQCHTNGNLWHKYHRFFIIYCILVTTMSHQWKSVAQMSQISHHTLYISDYNVSPMKIWGTNVIDFSSYIVY
jgi:hypothetical protein